MASLFAEHKLAVGHFVIVGRFTSSQIELLGEQGANHSGVGLPLLFAFLLMVLPEVLVWLEHGIEANVGGDVWRAGHRQKVAEEGKCGVADSRQR